jgi:hypothetical protein
MLRLLLDVGFVEPSTQQTTAKSVEIDLDLIQVNRSGLSITNPLLRWPPWNTQGGEDFLLIGAFNT